MMKKDRARLLRVLVYLAPIPLKVPEIARLSGIRYDTLFSKLRGRRRLRPEDAAAVLDAAGVGPVDLDAPLPEGCGPAVLAALRRCRFEISQDDLKAAVGERTVDALVSAGFLVVDEDGMIAVHQGAV